MSKQTFEAWMASVEMELRKLCGMQSDDLDDWRYYSEWEQGTKPLVAAKRAVRHSLQSAGLRMGA